MIIYFLLRRYRLKDLRWNVMVFTTYFQMVLQKKAGGRHEKCWSLLKLAEESVDMSCTHQIISFKCSDNTLIYNITFIIYQMPITVKSKRKTVGKYVSHNSRFFGVFFFLAAPHSLWDPSPPTRDWTPGPRQWEHGVPTTGPPRNSTILGFQNICVISIFTSIFINS